MKFTIRKVVQDLTKSKIKKHRCSWLFFLRHLCVIQALPCCWPSSFASPCASAAGSRPASRGIPRCSWCLGRGKGFNLWGHSKLHHFGCFWMFSASVLLFSSFCWMFVDMAPYKCKNCSASVFGSFYLFLAVGGPQFIVLQRCSKFSPNFMSIPSQSYQKALHTRVFMR